MAESHTPEKLCECNKCSNEREEMFFELANLFERWEKQGKHTPNTLSVPLVFVLSLISVDLEDSYSNVSSTLKSTVFKAFPQLNRTFASLVADKFLALIKQQKNQRSRDHI